MPTIRPSSDLRNKYSEISEFCHKYDEPVYITKNGQGDLDVMSIETYEKRVGKFELYKLLDEGLDAKKNQKCGHFVRRLQISKKEFLIEHELSSGDL
ncbi:antitoxin PHD [Paenibacillus sp. MY03]|uniref:type II toxin-antitoxin system Phd/YefM family antitoxin n=1 Tax=Paenibacillus sp. MY03 TaxID=302980 RepID=UPI000B3C10B1|nr:type II toxin-antitoxin system Phd/YefM family antitoxin [Paenibacillus sp. MY03]OUS76602.1 antitoxin PHD [Paenibacillus sp. MY03]